MSLKSVRETRGLSQSELSEISGVSLRSIQGYEIDYRNLDGAKLKTLLKLCIALECDMSELLENTELKKLYQLFVDNYLIL